MHNTLNATVRQRSGATFIDISGELNAYSEEALMAAYTQASNGANRAIVLNFSELDYMNSSGIGLLVTLLIRVQRQRQKLLAYGLSDHYREIFELTRLNEAIEIYEDEAGALAATQGPNAAGM
jgi:anti-sigma B factor antagonist